METVESPLDVLSRAATMVHRASSYPESAEDAENASNNSSCESKSTIGAPEKKSLSSGVKHMSKRHKSKTFSPRFRNLYTVDKAAARSHSFNDKSSVPKALSERVDRLQKSNNKLHRSDTDLNDEDDDRDDFSDSDTPTSPKEKAPKLPEYPGESPIDMSVKMKGSPPSYSQTISSGLHRPSVITQASNKVSPGHTKSDIGGKGEYTPGSMSMCDPVIDEHFRRSLGENYMALFGKSAKDTAATNASTEKKPNTKDRGSSPIMFPRDPCIKYLIPNPKYAKSVPVIKSNNDDESEKAKECKMDVDESAGLTVDDHFAKALGDTWTKLKDKPIANNAKNENAEKN